MRNRSLRSRGERRDEPCNGAPAEGLLVLVLLAVLGLTSYIDRLYSEMGKFLSRDFQDNIDVWEEHIEPRLVLSREQIALSATLLAQLSLALLHSGLRILLFDRGGHPARPRPQDVGQAVLGMVLVIVFCNRLLPHIFFTRTQGRWLLRWAGRFACYCWCFPVTVPCSFLLSIVTLAEPARRDGESRTIQARPWTP